MGKGPSVAQLAVKEKTAQRKRSKDFQESFKAGVFSISEDAGQGCFIPSKRARHRAPTTDTVQGSYEAPPPPCIQLKTTKILKIQKLMLIFQVLKAHNLKFKTLILFRLPLYLVKILSKITFGG